VHCSACLLELAPIEQQQFVYLKQHGHHQMWFRVGEPPGTLVAWNVGLSDRGRTANEDEGPMVYEAYVYAVVVDWWREDWPQMRVTVPWGATGSPSLRGVVIGARVIAAPDIPGSWRFRWWWPNPTWPETCSLDPPNADMTDDDAVRLNRARGAFYAFSERRGLKSGAKLAWPHDKATWREAGRQAEATFVGRHGRRPTDGELAKEMWMSKPTFDRRKRDWGPPTERK
jgi:hypothetical protein